MTDFSGLIGLLAGAHVEFIIVGGAAATAHGSARLTLDLDIVYRRTQQNIRRLCEVLSPCQPYLRGAPPGLPFRFDERTVLSGLNFTLTTSLGDLDLLGEITAGGHFEDLVPHSIPPHLYGCDTLCLDLEQLIKVKRATGRPKDLEAIAELTAILEERKRKGPDE